MNCDSSVSSTNSNEGDGKIKINPYFEKAKKYCHF